MNEVWNLDPIYKGFDDPQFEADLTRVKELVAEYGAFAAALAETDPAAGLVKGIAMQEEITHLVGKLAGYSNLRQSTNTRDSEAGSNMGRVMAVLSGMASPRAAFQNWAANLPNLMDLVRAEESLKDYEYLFSNIADASRYLLPGIGEEVMAKMELSGGEAWGDLQSYLTSTVPVSYRGTTTNLSSIRNLAYDADPAVRKAAYEAEIA